MTVCSSYLYFSHKKFHIFISPLCTTAAALWKTASTNSLSKPALGTESIEQDHFSASPRATLIPYVLIFFMSGRATHAASCAVISISCVIDNSFQACAASNTKPEYWLDTMNFLLFLSSAESIILKRGHYVVLLTKWNNLTLHLENFT